MGKREGLMNADSRKKKKQNKIKKLTQGYFYQRRRLEVFFFLKRRSLAFVCFNQYQREEWWQHFTYCIAVGIYTRQKYRNPQKNNPIENKD